MESDVRRKIVAQFRALGVPDDMVHEKVKCESGGEVDIVIHTQPRCLIEVKPVLDNACLTDATRQLKDYKADFPGARLFVASANQTSANPPTEPEWVRRRLRSARILLWSPAWAEQIAAECRKMPVQSKPVKQRKSAKEPPTAGASEDYVRVARSYRMARKHVSVKEAIRSVPWQNQRDLRKELRKLGIAKASTLAPFIKQRPAQLRKAIEAAQSLTIGEAQKWVSKQLGAKPRGDQRQRHSERLYREILMALPPEARDEAVAVFRAATLKLDGKGDQIGALRLIISEAKNGLLGTQ